MPLHAAWPTWMIFVLLVMFVGPMLKMMFGMIDPHAHKRLRQRMRQRFDESEDTGRLDAALAERDTVIEDLQHRLTELESRLDFAERLLADRHRSGELTPSP